MDLLDPKEDIVFKLLFVDPQNEALLISLIEAVLRPPSPIVSVTILNPEVGKEHVDDRGIVLDVLVRLADGTRVNLEMQCDPRGAIRDRWLYSWARLFSKGIQRGDGFAALAPVVCIVFLDARQGRRFHEIYRLLEVHDHVEFSKALAIHVIELPRLGEDADADGEGLQRWARFLRARSIAELQSLAAEDPIMAQAKAALERLSDDPAAQALAEARLTGRLQLQLEKERAHEEGDRGGRVRTLREMIVALSDVLGLEPTADQREDLASADLDRLEHIAQKLRLKRAWPSI